MSWYKKYKIKVDDSVDVQQFKMSTTPSELTNDAVDNTKNEQIQVDQPQQDQPAIPQQDQVPAPAVAPQPQANASISPGEFRSNLLNNCIQYIETLKESLQQELDFSNLDLTDKETKDKNLSFYEKVKQILISANREIDAYNKSDTTGQKVQPIYWKDVHLPEPNDPSASMLYLLLPYKRKTSNLGPKDENLPAIIEYIKSVLSSESITDDEDGALKLAEYAASNDHLNVRLLVNQYFGKSGRQFFHDALVQSGYPTLAEEFEKIDDKNLNYREFFGGKRKPAEVKPDTVYGKDFGLQTRSEAERQILEIFRALDLQPIPVEIKMPSTKAYSGKNVNTEFMCDFLLPCEVLRGRNEDGSPILESQVMFVGEYFGWYGSDYKEKTEMKEEVEPLQAVMSGSDVIFITKKDFEAGSNSLKLINQLEAKSILFKGGKTKQEVDSWLSQNKNHQNYNFISQRTLKLTPEIAIVRSAMLQLQFKFGEIAKFYENYNNDPEYRQLSKDLYFDYQKLMEKADRLNTELRSKQYRSRIKPENYSYEQLVGNLKSDSKNSERAESIQSLMNELQNIYMEIRNLYVNNPKIIAIKEKHNQALLNNTDYQIRLAELQTLENMLNENIDPLPNLNLTKGKKVDYICNNALAGLDVTLTRSKKEQEKEFKPKLITSLTKYKKFASLAEIDKLLDLYSLD